MERQERVVLHLDFDSYFASVEQQEHPELQGYPVVVTGSKSERSVVCAASREAKKYGVRSAMSLPEAKRLCPQVKVIPGNHEKYSRYTQLFLDILTEYTEDVEIASIDEMYVECTQWPVLRTNLENFISTLKDRAATELGKWITFSAGIAPNKFVAKVASDFRKPNGCMRVCPGNEAQFLRENALEDLPGIGKATSMKLAQLGITRVSDLQRAGHQFLCHYFGSHGDWLFDRAWGIDDTPLTPFWNEEEPKSIGHSTTFPRDVRDRSKIEEMLLALAERVGERLRAQQLCARVARLTVRFSDFSQFQKQVTLPWLVDDGFFLARAANALLPRVFEKPVRLVGITAAQLSKGRQANLFHSEFRRSVVLHTADQINTRWGRGTLRRARLARTALPIAKPSGF